ncbi:hypothetical protein CCACVL1_07946 [Corchorus capsularis]|uniref:Uncharacterized protein n=1 Tax=Corchorus capsularis TaxID=210143 RepID=A0A1R3J360_COCAP|nr:hypothetical protein CCACVL1_07946 [Corchorus capsularis]
MSHFATIFAFKMWSQILQRSTRRKQSPIHRFMGTKYWDAVCDDVNYRRKNCNE